MAAIRGDHEQVKKLLEQGQDPNVPDFAGKLTSIIYSPNVSLCNVKNTLDPLLLVTTIYITSEM